MSATPTTTADAYISIVDVSTGEVLEKTPYKKDETVQQFRDRIAKTWVPDGTFYAFTVMRKDTMRIWRPDLHENKKINPTYKTFGVLACTSEDKSKAVLNGQLFVESDWTEKK